MNSLEITDKKTQLENEYLDIISGAEKESRKLHDGENAEIERIKNEITQLDDELRKLTEEKEKDVKKINTHKIMEKKEFRLLDAINDVVNNKPMSEATSEIVSIGQSEMRKTGLNSSGQIVLPMETRANIVAGTATQGAEVVATEKFNILEPLRAKLVLAQAGATYLTGLTGDISIPAYSGSTCGWGSEVSSAADGAGAFSEVKLTPNRLTCFIDISKQFLIQDGVGAEQMLRNDIVKAVANKLESTILSADAAVVGTKPGGLLNGVTADAAAIDYKGVVALEKVLEEKNIVGDIKCIVSPSVKADLKTTEKAANTAKYLMEDGELNGYPVLSTSAVAGKGLIMGDFSDFVIAQWGALDLTVDPFTQAGNGKVRIVINAYFDAKPRRADAFVKKILKA